MRFGGVWEHGCSDLWVTFLGVTPSSLRERAIFPQRHLTWVANIVTVSRSAGPSKSQITHAFSSQKKITPPRENSSFSKTTGSYAEKFHPEVRVTMLPNAFKAHRNRSTGEKVISFLLLKFFFDTSRYHNIIVPLLEIISAHFLMLARW